MDVRIPSYPSSVTQQTLSDSNLLLRLVSIESVDANVIKDAIIELGEIFVRYNEWEDKLSTNLHLEGAKIFQDLKDICTAGNRIQIQVIRDFANKHFTQLNNILKNDQDKAPLRKPFLDGNWIWEEDLLNVAKALSPISPYTNQPFAERSHDFAKAIIRWIHSFSFIPAPSANRSIVPTTNNNAIIANQNNMPSICLDPSLMQIPENMPPQLVEMMRQYQLAAFQQLALLRQNERQSWEIAERSRELQQRTEQLIPMVRERIREGIEQAQQYAAELEQSLRNQVESYDQIRQQENQVLQSRLDVSTQRVQIVEGQNRQLGQRVSEVEASNARKDAEIAGLRSQVANAINAANNSGGGGGGGCTIL